MKTTIKILILSILFLNLSSCMGLANNLRLTFYNVTTNSLPHSHKVKRSGQNAFPQNNMSVVNLNFKTTSGYVDTIWRKVNNDGTFSDRISLTYTNPFTSGRIESMIEPGKYFLDGIRFREGNILVSEGSFRNMISRKQNGWDESRNEALWFSFEVKAGEELYVPDVIVAGKCLNGRYSCSNEDFVLLAGIENINSVKSDKYRVGYKVEILK